MKDFKGTKGFWEKGKDGFGDELMVYCDDSLGSAVADCRLPHSMKITIEEKYANAHLIAAAPDLLEALQVAVKAYRDKGWSSQYPPLKQAEAAISKALTGTDLQVNLT